MNHRAKNRSLEERARWGSWPLWLKGLFIFWPSLAPAYLFLSKLPFVGSNPEIGVMLSNIEYQNYVISYFFGLWTVNLVMLGAAWMSISLVSGLMTHETTSETGSKKVKDVKDVSKVQAPQKGLSILKKRPVGMRTPSVSMHNGGGLKVLRKSEG